MIVFELYNNEMWWMLYGLGVVELLYWIICGTLAGNWMNDEELVVCPNQ